MKVMIERMNDMTWLGNFHLEDHSDTGTRSDHVGTDEN